MTTKELNIHQRMNLMMKCVKYVKKREKKAGMQYSFVAHDDVTALLHEPFAECGIMPLMDVLSYTIDGNRHTVQISVSFVNIDKPEDKIVLTGWGYGLDTQDKGYGKAVTYALKYLYLKTFVLESGDEDEIDAYQNGDNQEEAKPKLALTKPPTVSKPALLTANQCKQIRKACEGLTDGALEEMKTFLEGKKLEQIEYSKFDSIMAAVRMSEYKEATA